MKFQYLLLLSLSCGLYTTTTQALVAPTNMVCSADKTPIRFNVSFNALYENAIIIKHAKTRKNMMTFNNYYQRGAGDSWKSGAGSWVAEQGGCYIIMGYHKKGKPDASKPFQQSKIRREGSRIGFEDASDNDFQDALVEFIQLAPPASSTRN